MLLLALKKARFCTNFLLLKTLQISLDSELEPKPEQEPRAGTGTKIFPK
jgi:hypothetical protein